MLRKLNRTHRDRIKIKSVKEIDSINRLKKNEDPFDPVVQSRQEKKAEVTRAALGFEIHGNSRVEVIPKNCYEMTG